jgi:riboflavin kinase/FMN adenylyltransferase
MVFLRSLEAMTEICGPVCVAIGIFDGVHRGHQELLARTREEAAARNATAVALTFDPHPARVLRPESAPHLLTSLPHKTRLIAGLGFGYLVGQTFDTAFAAQPPEEFLRRLAAAADLRMVCVGHNWAFGRQRSGNVALLTTIGRTLGFTTVEIDPVLDGGELISSTRIRAALQEGDFATARRLLGREFTILGTVRAGQQLGGKIGFPTANLAAHNEQFPPDGVYAVRAQLGDRAVTGVANIGVRPTVQDHAERSIEVHLFDFAESIYGRDLEVAFVERLRPEQRFASVEDLRAQIARDAAAARAVFASGK